MRRFVFRLDRVLDLRQREEKERARELGRALRAERSRKEALEEAEEKLGRCGEQISETAEAGVTQAGVLHNLDLAIKAAAGEVEAAEESSVSYT
ncbi:MAG: hypothetical protein QUU85_18090, partial [Candidatus Eisenbacteria bacterium]|nr:hypothetical protein [Candidatus Eisenbacteria bacterium]